MNHELHPSATLRLIRREMVRINEARSELMEAIDDPRLPAGVAITQIAQCDAEIAELSRSHDLIEDWLDATDIKAGVEPVRRPRDANDMLADVEVMDRDQRRYLIALAAGLEAQDDGDGGAATAGVLKRIAARLTGAPRTRAAA